MQSSDALAKAKLAEAATVRRLVYEAGFSFAQIDRDQGLRAGASRDVLRDPNQATEAAVAVALCVAAHELWPTRYLQSGERKPTQDYCRPPTMVQRRNLNRAGPAPAMQKDMPITDRADAS